MKPAYVYKLRYINGSPAGEYLKATEPVMVGDSLEVTSGDTRHLSLKKTIYVTKDVVGKIFRADGSVALIISG